MRLFIALMSLSLYAYAQISTIDIFPKGLSTSEHEGITVLDAKELSFEPIKEIEFSDISALAYDEQRGLFALSNKGYLFNLDLQIEGKKIKRLDLKEAVALKTKKGRQLKKKNRDAEGMALSQEGLIISFERRPKVSLYDFQGKKKRDFPLAKELDNIENYTRANKALESVVKHPDFGIITAPEAPLKGESREVHTLYGQYRKWRFHANGEITSIALMPDNDLLILERDYDLFRGHRIWLSKVRVMECEKGLCPSENLATLKSSDGWTLDNFEGLSRINEDMYLMISDDNGSFLQTCIVVLFEIRKTRAKP